MIGGIVIATISMTTNNRSKDEGFMNPVFEPVLADPSIIRAEDGYFYAYGTEDDWGDGGGSRYIPIVRSKDLIEWDFVGEAFDMKPDWKYEGGLWAPDVVFYNNQYYLYYSQSTWGDSNPAIGVAVSDSPSGPFEDVGKLFTSEEIGVQNSIDPAFYVDDDGTPYLFWGSFHGVYGVELEEDGFSVKGEKFEVAGYDFEAPYIIQRDGYYYFFGSLGACCAGPDSTYRVSVARAEAITGPYLDKNGNDIRFSQGTLILMSGSKDEEGNPHFVGPGHNAVVTDDEGTDWIVYHAIDAENSLLRNGATRRPLFIEPLVWEDGWPTVEGLTPSSHVNRRPVINQ